MKKLLLIALAFLPAGLWASNPQDRALLDMVSKGVNQILQNDRKHKQEQDKLRAQMMIASTKK